MKWPKSPRFRYSLRALLVFITLFMLWGGYHTNRSWKEREAERVLRAHGVSLIYFKFNSATVFGRLQSGYAYLVRLVWQERFITGASVNGNMTESVTEAICALPNLRHFEWSPSPITVQERDQMSREGPRPRAEMPPGVLERILASANLTLLSVPSWTISETDLVAIGSHETLEEVGLQNTNVSDQAFAGIMRLPHLRRLHFNYCDATGDLLDPRHGSESLVWIQAYDTPLNANFSRFVAQCPRLKHLEIGNESLDDEFVARLAGHRSLTHLGFTRATITDRSIGVFLTMPALESVGASESAVTPNGIRSLKRGRPQLKCAF